MDIQTLAAAQRAHFQTGATLTLPARREALQTLRREILAREGEITAALAADLNKSPAESYMCEVGMTLAELLSHTEISIDRDFINPFHAGNIVLTIVLVLTLIVIAIYYFITERILTKRLNLA